MFPSQYETAKSAWCQSNSKATYMLEIALQALAENKAQQTYGSAALANLSGFIAIALGGFRLDGGMVHVDKAGKLNKFISVHFVNSDKENADVKNYEATYRIDESVFPGAADKK